MPFRFRVIGFLPICFFVAHLRYHFSYGTPEQLLWICNFSNVLLACGFFLQLPVLIRVAFLWSIPGIPLWIIDMLNTGDYPPSTFLSHLGGFAVAYIGMAKVRSAPFTWFYALCYGLLLQTLSRWITPPALNVNVAFRPYYGWESVFETYWQWWLFITAIAAAGLWLLGLLARLLFPAIHQPAPE